METVLDFGVPTTAQGHIKRIWNYGHPLLNEALDDTIKVREHFFSCEALDDMIKVNERFFNIEALDDMIKVSEYFFNCEALDDMIKCWFQKVNTLSRVVFYDITNASGNFIK